MLKPPPPVAQNYEKIINTDRLIIKKAVITVTDFQLQNWGNVVRFHFTKNVMFGNFNAIENGGFHCLSTQSFKVHLE